MQYVSASQIEKFQRCPRRWAHTYLDGMREPGSQATEFGSSFHSAVENYLKTGIIAAPESAPRRGRIVLLIASAISGGHIEHATFKGICEKPIEDGSFRIAGLPVRGFIDWYEGGDNPKIIDHKTTSNWEYAKSSEELAFNTQMLIYAAWALAQNPNAESVLLRHIQYATTGRVEVRSVEVVVSRAHVAKQMKRISAIVEQMKKVLSSAVALRKTADCGSFGRRCTFEANGMCTPTSSLTELIEMPLPFDIIKKRAAQRASLNPPDVKRAPQMPARKPKAPQQAPLSILRDSIIVERSLSDGNGGFYKASCGLKTSEGIADALALLDVALRKAVNRDA